MIVQDQSAVRAMLADPRSHGGSPVTVIETHISAVFLAGDRAFKLKRAVRLPYVDLSTPERRLAVCRREVALNRRTAAELYLGVRAIDGGPGGPVLRGPDAGAGALLDAVVEMRRFDQDALLDARARAGRLHAGEMAALARAVAAFHDRAEVRHGRGGAARVADVLAVNEAAFATGAGLAATRIAALTAAFRSGLDAHRDRLDAREAAGRVRLCHGDLHLRNIVLIGGCPVLFDCLEFNDDLATVDVAYDVAFLLMDLRHRSLSGFANLVMNRWIEATGDEGALPLLPFLMALRAAVRAHVSATQAAGPDADGPGLVARARTYADLAEALLAPPPPRIVALGGLSGSGKSTVAAGLAAWLGGGAGARVLSSDRLRKARFGVATETRLPAAAYAPAETAAVYGRLAAEAEAAARAGATVVLDATFVDPAHRAQAAAAARAAGVPFTGFRLAAPAGTLRARVAGRTGGASDADGAVLERQLAGDDGAPEWRPVDATAPPAAAADAILAALGLPPVPAGPDRQPR